MPNISYIDEGNKEVIVFFHGWGQNKEMMMPLIDNLKHKYRCVILDLPGFGNSLFDDSKNIDEYTQNLRQFLEKENITPKYIIGHSFGGKLAVNYYLKYKDIKGLVLIASPILKPKRTLKYYYKLYLHKLKKKLKLNLNKSGSEDYKNCPPNMKKFFINVVNTHFDKHVKHINIPTLLIWGERDNKVPLNKGIKLNKNLKDSRLIKIKGEHFAYLENIDFTRLIIQKFFRRLENE